VNANASIGDLVRHRLGENRDGGLGSCIGSVTWLGCPCRIRGDVYDDPGSPGDHPWYYRERAGNHAEDVHIEDLTICGRKPFLDGRELLDAGVVDEHVDAPVLLLDLTEDMLI